MLRKVRVRNIDTDVEYDVMPEFYEANKLQFVFVKYIDIKVPGRETPVADDIHQMNKFQLLKYATEELNLEVSNKMTVAKIKEAIEDKLNSKE